MNEYAYLSRKVFSPHQVVNHLQKICLEVHLNSICVFLDIDVKFIAFGAIVYLALSQLHLSSFFLKQSNFLKKFQFSDEEVRNKIIFQLIHRESFGREDVLADHTETA